MAHDAFISYSTKDQRIAEEVCAFLEGRGVRCWIAPRNILAGTEWNASIIDAINYSKIFILIYSANANASSQVQREVGWAANKGLAILPFRIEDVPMSEGLAYFISTRQWLDALTPPLHKHLDSLGRAVEALLQKEAPSAPAAIPSNKRAAQPRESLPDAPLRPTRVSKKGWSPASWVLTGCGVLILLTIILLFVSGWFAKKRFERRSDLAAAELVVGAIPDLELVSKDEDAGTLTVKNEKTGEVATLNARDVKEGRIELKTGKDSTVTDGSAGDGAFVVTDETGRVTAFRTRPDEVLRSLPPWLPVYPGGTIEGSFDSTTAEGLAGTFTVTTRSPVAAVREYYEIQFKSKGLKVDPDHTSDSFLSVKSGDEKRQASVLVSSSAGQAQAVVTYQEKQ